MGNKYRERNEGREKTRGRKSKRRERTKRKKGEFSEKELRREARGNCCLIGM